ncbi:transposase [Streptomyces sp. OE57]|uniref:transposase n=1 Tax=Streptomyces lacaronensis TaxID=3379885 RepID=UPI0039B73A7D
MLAQQPCLAGTGFQFLLELRAEFPARQPLSGGGCRRDLARDLLADLRRIDRQVRDNEAQLREHHFASYTGTAPVDASSGKNTRHRLNTGGNRALNSVLHIIAVCQIRDGGRGQEYYLRKIAEGKTPAEARRALKRRLSNVVYRTLKRDHHTALTTAA